MKKLQILATLMIIGMSAYCQSTIQNDLKGKWLAVQNRDTLRLIFSENSGIYADLGHDKMQGQYKSRIDSKSKDIILTIRPADIKRKDSLMITLSKINQDEYQIKQVMRYFDEYDRPSQSELYEGNMYILRRMGNN